MAAKRVGGDAPISKANKPKPPQFIEVMAKGGGKSDLIKLSAEPKTLGPTPLRIVPPGSVEFISQQLTEQDPVKSYDQPAHRYKSRVDSKTEAKGAISSSSSSSSSVYYDEEGKAVPKYLGTKYTHIPNAPFRDKLPKPRAPSLPRPFVPEAKEAFNDFPLLANRTPDGKILGAYSKRYMDPTHVPYLDHSQTVASAGGGGGGGASNVLTAPDVGPDNPIKQLNETWSACWDDQAGAVYYYNNITGEATWYVRVFEYADVKPMPSPFIFSSSRKCLR